MTKHIDDFLDIPHEDELNEDGTGDLVETSSVGLPVLSDDEIHAREAEEIRKKALDLQEEIADVARNVAPDRSARMFEVSGQHLKIALEASNSKEKRKLEAAKLKLEAAKLKIEDDTVASLNSGKEIIANRNDLIRQLIAEEEGNVVDVETDATTGEDK